MAAGTAAPRLFLRAVNWLTGQVLVDDLPHLHQSSWDVRMLAPGTPPSGAVGPVTIPLHPPRSPEYRKAKVLYDQLDNFTRIEAYRGPGPVGAPAFSCFITDGARPQSFRQYTLQGQTDLGWAALFETFPGELLKATRSDYMLQAWSGAPELVFADDFTGFTGAGYSSTNVSGSTAGAWSATTYDGAPAVTDSTGSGALLITNGAYAVDSSTGRSCLVEAVGSFHTNGGSATNNGEFGVMIGASATSGALFKLRSKWNGASYDFDLVMRDLATGTETVAANALSGVDSTIVGNGMDFTFQVWLSSYNNEARVTINGGAITGPGAAGTFNVAPSLVPAAGATNKVGLYFSLVGGASEGVTFSSLLLRRRWDQVGGSQLFTLGTIGTPVSAGIFDSAIGPTYLDMLARACSQEGWSLRSTPVAMTPGVRTIGTLTANTSVGTDLSSVVRFEEGDNLVDVQNGLSFAEQSGDVRLSSPVGSIVWPNVASLRKYGALTVAGLSVSARDFRALKLGAQQRSGAQGYTAKTITVLRDPRTADRWREGDTVTLHAPTFGILNQAYTVIAYTFTENSRRQTITLGQLPYASASARQNSTAGALKYVARTYTPRA